MANDTSAQHAGECPVNTWNEWDPLEEVIVGTPFGAHVHFSEANPLKITSAPLHLEESGNLTLNSTVLRAYDGTPFPPEVIRPTFMQIENFVHVLRAEGVTVRRPDPYNLATPISTPHWQERAGHNFMNPRDLLLVIGNQIIEAPSPLRRRYFEAFAFRRLLREYYRAGAKWVSAPRPTLEAELYDLEGVGSGPNDSPRRFMTTEFEPVFDAASFARCGKDIFVIRDHTTNMSGIEWLQRHLGDEHRIHVIGHKARNPMHIDVIFIPLAPGKAVINPDFIGELPPILKKWDLLKAPPPNASKRDVVGFPEATTSWISLNVFSIDAERVFVEEQQVDLIKALKDWGFKPIPVPFTFPPILSGGFHCATLDIRRRGSLQSYF